MPRLPIPLCILLAAVSASAQTTKQMKFEVVSIRPTQSGPAGFNPHPTPDGFNSALTVWQMLMVAYAPGSSDNWLAVPIQNLPDWTKAIPPDWYVVSARVAPADIDAWQHQRNNELLHSAMQAALHDRLKLAAHLRPQPIPDYKLVIAKHGLRMKPTPPNFTLPAKPNLASGGVMVASRIGNRTQWNFYNATIEDLTNFLNMSSKTRPVQDATNLTGRYTFSLLMSDHPTNDFKEAIYNWPVDDLGLSLKPGTSPGFALVIDHIEKPSPN